MWGYVDQFSARAAAGLDPPLPLEDLMLPLPTSARTQRFGTILKPLMTVDEPTLVVAVEYAVGDHPRDRLAQGLGGQSRALGQFADPAPPVADHEEEDHEADLPECDGVPEGVVVDGVQDDPHLFIIEFQFGAHGVQPPAGGLPQRQGGSRGGPFTFSTAPESINLLSALRVVSREDTPECSQTSRCAMSNTDRPESACANLFFQLVSSRYERASLIVTSNKNFARWGEVFGDDTVAAAMIDRLVHHAEVIALKGDSYRLKNRELGRVPAAVTEEN